MNRLAQFAIGAALPVATAATFAAAHNLEPRESPGSIQRDEVLDKVLQSAGGIGFLANSLVLTFGLDAAMGAKPYPGSVYRAAGAGAATAAIVVGGMIVSAGLIELREMRDS